MMAMAIMMMASSLVSVQNCVMLVSSRSKTALFSFRLDPKLRTFDAVSVPKLRSCGVDLVQNCVLLVYSCTKICVLLVPVQSNILRSFGAGLNPKLRSFGVVSVQSCVLVPSRPKPAFFWCRIGKTSFLLCHIGPQLRSFNVVSIHLAPARSTAAFFWYRLGPKLRSRGVVAAQNCVLLASSQSKSAFLLVSWHGDNNANEIRQTQNADAEIISINRSPSAMHN